VPKKLWRLHPHDETAARRLAAAAQTSEVVAQLLLNRGVTDPTAAKLFLQSPMSGLHPPGLLPGIAAAAARLASAIATGERVCVYGDYDVDGTTGTAILFALLGRLGANVGFEIPLRLEDGYGLNAGSLQKLAAEGVKVVVTVDCGISAIAEADLARDLGLDLIVTDHHEMKDTLPAATLVHPRLPGSEYPFGGISGSCVAFKLAWAVAQRASGGAKVTDDLREFLLDAMGLAALGLVADVVPLRDENRVFTRHGLKRLVTRPSVGLRALFDEAKLTDKLTAEDVSFKLGPRINAAGRLGCARLVVELLTTTNPKRAGEIAEFLEGQNGQRQSLERKATAQAKEMIGEHGWADGPALVLGHTDWHQGVVGIVAGRLAEHFGKPTLVVSLKENDQPSTGSGRGVAGFELHKAVEACADLLEGHGGHAAAVGVRVKPSNLDALRERFGEQVKRTFTAGEPPPPQLLLDAELPLAALTYKLLGDIDKLEPFGQDNPRPRFLASDVQIDGTPRRIGQGERHLSFRVRQGGTTVRAVAWGMGDRLDDLMADGGRCCLAFTPKINEWNGQRTVEIEVIDFQARRLAELR
jgi:single-stranded-DNA-specific exonuclease